MHKNEIVFFEKLSHSHFLNNNYLPLDIMQQNFNEIQVHESQKGSPRQGKSQSLRETNDFLFPSLEFLIVVHDPASRVRGRDPRGHNSHLIK